MNWILFGGYIVLSYVIMGLVLKLDYMMSRHTSNNNTGIFMFVLSPLTLIIVSVGTLLAYVVFVLVRVAARYIYQRNVPSVWNPYKEEET